MKPHCWPQMWWDRDLDVVYLVRTLRMREKTPHQHVDAVRHWNLRWSWPHDGRNSTLAGAGVPLMLGLLRELVPAAARIAVLFNPANIASTSALGDVEAAARDLGLQLLLYKASSSREIDAAFATLVGERPDALFVAPDGFFVSRRVQLTALAARHALPVAYPVRDFVEAGGLMSYSTSLSDMYRQVGIYAGRILKGAKPADLPVGQSTKFHLVINHQTARLLGLTVPPQLLARADEVIE